MPQDKESGGRAAKWGRETAMRVADEIGATEFSTRSNECTLNGRHVVIKCAAAKTNNVGVTYPTLNRVDRIIGAFQREDGSFDLWELTAAEFRGAMREAAGVNRGKQGKVVKFDFERGRSVGRIVL